METRSEKELLGANINVWAKGLQESHPDLAESLDEPRSVGYLGVERLGLPEAPNVTVELEEFIQFPEKFAQILETKSIVINLTPKVGRLQRHAGVNLSPEEALNFVWEKVAVEDVAEYKVIVFAFGDITFSGNVIIDPEGAIIMESRAGQLGPLASGKVVPEYSMSRDKHLGTFKYSFEDAGVRQKMYETLMVIPHEGEGRDVEFTPGYYEFIWQDLGRPQGQELFFVDYRDNPAYWEVNDQDNKN